MSNIWKCDKCGAIKEVNNKKININISQSGAESGQGLFTFVFGSSPKDEDYEGKISNSKAKQASINYSLEVCELCAYNMIAILEEYWIPHSIKQVQIKDSLPFKRYILAKAKQHG
jgi:hypothetical protein